MDADGAGPAAEAALLGQAQTQQRHDVCAVRVHRLRQRRRIHPRQRPCHIVPNVSVPSNMIIKLSGVWQPCMTLQCWNDLIVR